MRIENWPTVLMDMVEKAESEPFVWGKNDCCLWVADVVLAITSRDFAVNLRGKYSTEKEATLLYDGYTLKHLIGSILGASVSVNFAQRGDVVMCKFKAGETLGICIGAKAVFKTETGIIQVPILRCDFAWRIE